MHPASLPRPPMTPRAPLRFGLPLPAVLLLLSGSAVAQPGGAAPVVVSEAFIDSTRTLRPVVGTVMPERHVTVGSAVDGRVSSFPINTGDRIEQGGTLAQLLTETIKLELAAAEAELKLRQEEERELKNGSRPEEIAKAKGERDAASAVLSYAKARYERVRSSFDAGSVTRESFEQAVSEYASALGTHSATDAAFKLVEAGPRDELKQQAAAKVAMQQATVDKLRDQIKKHTIISRFNGYVVAEHTEEGAWVNRGDPVAEVAAVDVVHVRVSVLENYVSGITAGVPVRVTIPSLSREFSGTVKSVTPLADARSRTFPIEITLKNEFVSERPVLKPGMLARAYLPIGRESETSVMVPKDALVLGQQTPLVYVVGKGDKVRPVPVTIGAPKGVFVAVSGEVAEKDRVVILGNERLRPGAEVRIVKTVTREELESGGESVLPREPPL